MEGLSRDLDPKYLTLAGAIKMAAYLLRLNDLPAMARFRQREQDGLRRKEVLDVVEQNLTILEANALQVGPHD